MKNEMENVKMHKIIVKSIGRKCFFSGLVILSLLMMLFSGCTYLKMPGDDITSQEVYAMDTVMTLNIYECDNQDVTPGGLLTEAAGLIYELDGKLSTTLDTSEISAVNAQGAGSVSPETASLLDGALEMCRKTDGALDISIYPVVKAWGFTTEEYRVPSDDEIKGLLEKVDYRQVEVTGTDTGGDVVLKKPGMQIDLGSVAKGFTGDYIAGYLKQNGVTSGLLSLGGNIRCIGTKPDGSNWKVLVQAPDSDGYVGCIEAADKSLVTSGGYERYFEKDGEIYWHIMDPATGKPARNGIVSVTIVGDDGIQCDALSTALFVKGLDKAVEYWRENRDFEAVFITDEGDVYITEGLESVFTLDSNWESGGLNVIR